jgi:hypothetical protein
MKIMINVYVVGDDGNKLREPTQEELEHCQEVMSDAYMNAFDDTFISEDADESLRVTWDFVD